MTLTLLYSPLTVHQLTCRYLPYSVLHVANTKISSEQTCQCVDGVPYFKDAVKSSNLTKYTRVACWRYSQDPCNWEKDAEQSYCNNFLCVKFTVSSIQTLLINFNPVILTVFCDVGNKIPHLFTFTSEQLRESERVLKFLPWRQRQWIVIMDR
jgi:hypothetical protein